MKLVWKAKTGKYEHGYLLFAGPIALAEADYVTHGRGEIDPKNWRSRCLLPQMGKTVDFKTDDEAKAMAERKVKQWFIIVNQE